MSRENRAAKAMRGSLHQNATLRYRFSAPRSMSVAPVAVSDEAASPATLVALTFDFGGD